MSFLELEKKDLSVYVVPGKNMNLIIEKRVTFRLDPNSVSKIFV